MWQYFAGNWYFFPVLIWTLVWKGIALWKSARSGEKSWFVALFIINTVGILEIVYIFGFAKKKGLKNLMD